MKNAIGCGLVLAYCEWHQRSKSVGMAVGFQSRSLAPNDTELN
ncbi:MAG: hypothetical protein AAGM36_10225 [Cyanobacteria bacterium J06597_1]